MWSKDQRFKIGDGAWQQAEDELYRKVRDTFVSSSAPFRVMLDIQKNLMGMSLAKERFEYLEHAMKDFDRYRL